MARLHIRGNFCLAGMFHCLFRLYKDVLPIFVVSFTFNIIVTGFVPRL